MKSSMTGTDEACIRMCMCRGGGGSVARMAVLDDAVLTLRETGNPTMFTIIILVRQYHPDDIAWYHHGQYFTFSEICVSQFVRCNNMRCMEEDMDRVGLFREHNTHTTQGCTERRDRRWGE